MVSLTLDSELVARGDGTFAIVSSARVDDGEVARFTRDRLRVSLSWKADVFGTDDDRRRHDEHREDLDADEVLRRISADLADRVAILQVLRVPDEARLRRWRAARWG